MEISHITASNLSTCPGIESEQILLFLSNDMSYFTYFNDIFNAYYETKKIDFYEAAIKSEFYRNDLFSDKRLQQEISMRRIFSILLSAEDDEIVKDFVWKTIDGFPYTKEMFKALKKKDNLSLRKFFNKIDKTDNSLLVVSKMLVLYYIHCYFRLDTEDKKIIDILEETSLSAIYRLTSSYDNIVESIRNIDYLKTLTVDIEHKRVLRKLRNMGEILSIMDINVSPVFIDCSTLSDSIKPLMRYAEEQYDIVNLNKFLTALSTAFNYFKISPTCYFQESNLSDEDKQIILKIASHSFDTSSKKDLPKLSFYHIIISALSYQIAKNMKEDRDCFFKNSSETQFFALKESELKINKLSAEISNLNIALKEEIIEKSKYKDLYGKLQSEVFENKTKNEREVYSTFKEEIDTLKDKIVSLEKQLAEKDKDSEELHRLRELAFSLKSGDIPAKQTKTIDELIGNNKVIIVGGHINLRNKLAKKYKSISILDGHNVNFDENLIKSADLVLFNTANMSHSLYYKVIPIIKTHLIKFDYISKSLNLDILEAEISILLEKHLK